MSQGGKKEAGKTGDVSLTQDSAADNETFAEALTKEGFEPAKVGRKIVSQGKRRETLKTRGSETSDR
ncbi:hypothetical protein ASD63_23475 [Ensifer sp. Root558]|nr:hypothetical protein ASD63_23475 [Ensifer sp. Root558]